jgi:CRP-like cAMP-binding protein
MNMTSGNHAAPIIRHFETIFKLSDDERAALEKLPMQLSDIRADQEIVREGDRPSRCFAVLEGFACTFKVTGEGKRQIVAFHVPGDMPDVQSLHLEVLDITIGTLTPCKIGFVQHEAMRDLCMRFPRIAGALWRDTLIDAAIFREWVMNVGRRQAYGRIAHILCEWIVKMRAAGLAEDHTCELPMTQTELADATGMTTVHVNRTLMDLRRDGLIDLKGSKLAALDWEGLKQAGDFDPTYLHLRKALDAAA